jgi:ketosteroid isomerase-like protein
MDTDPHEDDVRAIEAIVARQFASLCWSPGGGPDRDAFAADFAPDASLHPAARPARRQTVQGFLDRMEGLAGTDLRRFHETVLGTEVRVFGNVATALAACEIRENGGSPSRGVEMMLLVKDEGRWRIVSQAWDVEGPSRPIPARLLGAAGAPAQPAAPAREKR